MKEIFIKKFWEEEDTWFWFHYVDGWVERQIEISPQGKVFNSRNRTYGEVVTWLPISLSMKEILGLLILQQWPNLKTNGRIVHRREIEVSHIFGHTHPFVTGASRADFEALSILNQSKQYIYEAFSEIPLLIRKLTQ